MKRLFPRVGALLLSLSLISAPATAQLDPSLTGLPQATSVAGDEIISTLGRDGRKAITVSDLQRSLGIAAPRGAVGDGVADDSEAIRNLPYLFVGQGKRYRLKSSLKVGTILSNGGLIDIDPGVTLSFDTVVGDPSTTIFTGQGTARSLSGTYSVGWYAGATYDAKWDFARRAFMTGGRKVVIHPYPKADDPAASYNATINQVSWKVANSLKFGDPENNSEQYQYSTFTGVTPGMNAIVEYSLEKKTEDIYWRNGIAIDCAWNAVSGELIHAGARIQHQGYNRISRCRTNPFLVAGDMPISPGSGAGADQITYDFLNLTENGMGGRVVGTATHIPYGFEIKYLFSNGMKGLFGTAVVSGGVLTGVNISATGPNGSAQDLRGFVSAQPLTVQSRPGNGNNGRAAVVTPVIGAGSLITGVTVTNGGTGFTNDETVFMTAAESLITLSGQMRKVVIGQGLENQDDNSNLAPVYGAYYLQEATVDGAPQSVDWGPLRSISGRARALIVRKASGDGNVAKNRFSIRQWRVPNVFNNSEQLSIGWADEGNITDPPQTFAGSGKLINASTDATYLKFYGIARELVTGNGEGFLFDGVRDIYSEGFGPGSMTSTACAVPGGPSATIRRLRLITNAANINYEGDISCTLGFLSDVKKGSLVDTTNTALTGSTGGAGRVTLSVANGRIYIENTTASTNLIMKLIPEY